MRPKSYREQNPEKCCANCYFAKLIPTKDDMLCFYGDKIEIEESIFFGSGEYIILDGVDISLLTDEEYATVWGGRVVDRENICDEHKENMWSK